MLILIDCHRKDEHIQFQVMGYFDIKQIRIKWNKRIHYFKVILTMITNLILRNLGRAYFSISESIPKPNQINYKTDWYKGIHLSLNGKIPQHEFKWYVDMLLKKELQGNKQLSKDQETNSIWVHLEGKQLGYASSLLQMGFNIHHGLGQKLSLCKWISEKKDLITPFSQFFISCGAMIIKDNKVFLVQQKNGARKGDYGLPGGRADPGQTINSCSQRQLLQQTGIKAKFNYILHFRQLQKTTYGAMDIYFACLMSYEQSALQNIKLCERELSGYKWVHLSQYGQFCHKNSVGTQYQLAKYVTNLYKSGYDFKKRVANQITCEKYKSGKDNVQRLVVQHGLIEGCKIQKLY